MKNAQAYKRIVLNVNEKRYDKIEKGGECEGGGKGDPYGVIMYMREGQERKQQYKASVHGQGEGYQYMNEG